MKMKIDLNDMDSLPYVLLGIIVAGLLVMSLV